MSRARASPRRVVLSPTRTSTVRARRHRAGRRTRGRCPEDTEMPRSRRIEEVVQSGCAVARGRDPSTECTHLRIGFRAYRCGGPARAGPPPWESLSFPHHDDCDACHVSRFHCVGPIRVVRFGPLVSVVLTPESWPGRRRGGGADRSRSRAANSFCLAARKYRCSRWSIVDADAAVDVHGGVGDAMAGIGGPELRDLDLGLGRQSLRQTDTRPATGSAAHP